MYYGCILEVVFASPSFLYLTGMLWLLLLGLGEADAAGLGDLRP